MSQEDISFAAEALAEEAGVPLRWWWVSRAALCRLSPVTRLFFCSPSLWCTPEPGGEGGEAAGGGEGGSGVSQTGAAVRPPPSGPSASQILLVAWWEAKGKSCPLKSGQSQPGVMGENAGVRLESSSSSAMSSCVISGRLLRLSGPPQSPPL